MANHHDVERVSSLADRVFRLLICSVAGALGFVVVSAALQSVGVLPDLAVTVTHVAAYLLAAAVLAAAGVVAWLDRRR